jgi:hypothetical protein
VPCDGQTLGGGMRTEGEEGFHRTRGTVMAALGNFTKNRKIQDFDFLYRV